MPAADAARARRISATSRPCPRARKRRPIPRPAPRTGLGRQPRRRAGAARCGGIGQALSGAETMLTPKPMTMACVPSAASCASSRMPASLAPSASTSLGHLSAMRHGAATPSTPCRTTPAGRTAASARLSATPATKPRRRGNGRIAIGHDQEARSKIARRAFPRRGRDGPCPQSAAARQTRPRRHRGAAAARALRCWSSRFSSKPNSR